MWLGAPGRPFPLPTLVVNALGVLYVMHRRALLASESALWTAERQARSALELTLSELRTLHGIIPICAYCREVRSEVGDWQRLEAYVRAHSEAEFTHGICPECAVQIYGKYMNKTKT